MVCTSRRYACRRSRRFVLRFRHDRHRHHRLRPRYWLRPRYCRPQLDRPHHWLRPRYRCPRLARPRLARPRRCPQRPSRSRRCSRRCLANYWASFRTPTRRGSSSTKLKRTKPTIRAGGIGPQPQCTRIGLTEHHSGDHDDGHEDRAAPTRLARSASSYAPFSNGIPLCSIAIGVFPKGCDCGL